MHTVNHGRSPAWQIDKEDVASWHPPPFPNDVTTEAINFAWLLHPKSLSKAVPVRQVGSENGERYSDI